MRIKKKFTPLPISRFRLWWINLFAPYSCVPKLYFGAQNAHLGENLGPGRDFSNAAVYLKYDWENLRLLYLTGGDNGRQARRKNCRKEAKNLLYTLETWAQTVTRDGVEPHTRPVWPDVRCGGTVHIRLY